MINPFRHTKITQYILQKRSWEKLQNAVLAIQTSRPISTSLEELYQMVENLSSMGQAEKVSYLPILKTLLYK